MTKVLVGIVTHNRAPLFRKAIISALAQTYPNLQVAVLDDASTDETATLQAEFPQVIWQRTTTAQGVVYGRNQLMQNTDADYYVSLDDDAWFLEGDEIERGVSILEQDARIGAVGYHILSSQNTHLYARLTPYPIHTYIGCGHILRLSVAREVGFYAPRPANYATEEEDLCLRLLDLGYEILFTPGIHVWHDATPRARDVRRQHRARVCNELGVIWRRCPLPMLLWLLPAKILRLLYLGSKRKLLDMTIVGVVDFFRKLPMIHATRKTVRAATMRLYRQRIRTRRSSRLLPVRQALMHGQPVTQSLAKEAALDY